MPRGVTTITLDGGNFHGQVFEDVPLNRLPPEIHMRREAFYAEGEGGNVLIMKGELTPNWMAYAVDCYVKRDSPLDKRSPGTIYEFTQTSMVDRCTQLTKKGVRCNNIVFNCDDSEKALCRTHSRQPKGTVND